jgi:uncharacterized protein
MIRISVVLVLSIFLSTISAYAAPPTNSTTASPAVALEDRAVAALEAGKAEESNSLEAAARLYKSACDAGNADGCSELKRVQGSLDYIAHEQRARPIREANAHIKACAADNSLACDALGYAYENGEGVSSNIEQASKFYAKACDGRIARACFRLGALYTKGLGVIRDDMRAKTLFIKACDYGDIGGCFNLGGSSISTETAPGDIASKVAVFEKTCGEGIAQACFNVGAFYGRNFIVVRYGGLTEDAIARDIIRAKTFYEKACDGGIVVGCFNLAVILAGEADRARDKAERCRDFEGLCELLGEHRNRISNAKIFDVERAISFYAKACNDEFAAACFNLAVLYYEGFSVKRDFSSALSSYIKACDKGIGESCFNIGNMYRNAEITPFDIKRAVSFFAKSCGLGLAEGCVELGLSYENGNGIGQDPVLAKSYYDKALAIKPSIARTLNERRGIYPDFSKSACALQGAFGEEEGEYCKDKNK